MLEPKCSVVCGDCMSRLVVGSRARMGLGYLPGPSPKTSPRYFLQDSVIRY